MSKQHTPIKYGIIELRNSIDIWEVNSEKCICSTYVLPETRKDSMDKMEFVLNILNNHDRLVEALEYLLEGINGLPPLTAIAGVLVPHCDKAKKLLTELKS